MSIPTNLKFSRVIHHDGGALVVFNDMDKPLPLEMSINQNPDPENPPPPVDQTYDAFNVTLDGIDEKTSDDECVNLAMTKIERMRVSEVVKDEE